MADKSVSIDFVMGAEPLIYRDAIVLPESVYRTMSPEDIEAEKASRYEAWLLIANPPEDSNNG
jgi:hypothetical protein